MRRGSLAVYVNVNHIAPNARHSLGEKIMTPHNAHLAPNIAENALGLWGPSVARLIANWWRRRKSAAVKASAGA